MLYTVQKNSLGVSMNVVDLFCGCGGLSLGFEQAGYNILLGIDHDKSALETFKRNHKGSEIIHGDIQEVTASDIRKIIGNKTVDVIIGGPPCQGLSLSGPRKLDDPRNKLFLSYVRLVRDFKPKFFVLENVPGIISLFKGKIKEQIIKEFSELGYKVEYEVLNSAHYGVPQIRKRAIFIGSITNSDISYFPEKIIFEEKNFITCEQAVSDLHALDDDSMPESFSYATKPQSAYQTQMRKGAPEKLHNHLITKHQDNVKLTIALVPEGGNYKNLPEDFVSTRKFNVAWTRYHSKKPASTIDTGHRHHFHYKYNRVPTVRENARFQSFPDSFIFFGNKTEQYRQVGNAVPPLLGKAIAQRLISQTSVNELYDEKRTEELIV
ncbi:DNA cytosine methyltransferase [Vibrio cholerae]|uniref:DNA cytosine methyltransferase n=1 Tax=Vibrio cholerae TaxID=666 RepID=UPI00115B0F82|nr:DNA cytosine methyltransferase [Vibrio cholerae]TQP51792.1 DNA cytosine methyltransferase [Vibrio cholerae]